MEPPKPGFGVAVKPQKSGYGLGLRVFPGVGAQPGFNGRNGVGISASPKAGSLPGPPTQNGHGPGTSESMKSPKPGFSNGNGIGAEALPGVGAQPGLVAQNGIGADVGVGGKLRKTAPAAQNGYRQGYGTDLKTQKPGSWNGHGLGVQLGYRNGLGPRTFQGQGLRPGYRLGIPLGLGVSMKLPKAGYNLGNGVAAQPGSCNGGIAPPQFLPGPPTTVPSDKGGGWGLKSQLPPPVQNGKFPAPTPAIQWGPKPQKAGYQPSDGYGAGAQLGFHGGLKLQKVGFHYGNAALEAGILPEILQSGFPTANGFSNGLREETLLYPKATVPTLERHGQAGAFQPWGAGVKPEYGYAGLGIQTGPYGQLRPELRLEHLGDPELKTYTKSPLGNGYRGHCPSGEC
nr:glycine rich extracellular protein 1 isoform X9 [Rattus norvegicus]